MAEWKRQRRVYANRETADLDDLGFAALFLNRTNRSGIISGGVIGGKSQNGKWKMDARFNKDTLIQRLRKIGRYRDRIRLYQMDALDFTNEILPRLGHNSFTFFDPPYFDIQRPLYLNDYEVRDHRLLATRISELNQPWIVTYDLGAIRHKLYSGFRRMVYYLNYTTNRYYAGKEVLFFSDGLTLPDASRLFTGTMKKVPHMSRLRIAA